MVQQYDGRGVIVGTDCIENDVKSDIMPCNMRNHDVKNAINAKYTESKMPSFAENPNEERRQKCHQNGVLGAVP